MLAGTQSGRPTIGDAVVNSEVTPPRELGGAGRLLHDGADDGDLEVRDLVSGNHCVVHL